jgi:hypothetical protein
VTLKVVPGSLPADGSRINIQDTLDTFIGGTRIHDFRVQNFASSAMSFVLSTTEAPTTNQLHRGLLWFKRGEGRMYRWTPRPVESGATGAWVSCSVRKEMLVQMRHPVTPGEILWSDPSPSEYKLANNESKEFICIKLAGANHTFNSTEYTADSNATAAAHFEDMKLRPFPPYFVANESVAASNYGVVTELGFVNAQYTGAGQYGCMIEGVNVPYVTGLSATYATETNARIADILGSGDGTALIFLHQGPSNLCR